MATVAAMNARRFRAEQRAHRNWNDCDRLGHNAGDAHMEAAWDAMSDGWVRCEDWRPDDDNVEAGDVMESFGGSIFEFNDGSILLHSDDGVYDERVEVLRGRKRELAIRVLAGDPAVRAYEDPLVFMAARRAARRAALA